MKTRQSGITLIGFLLVMGVLCFFAYMAMRLVPSYIEYMGVVKAVEQVGREGMDGKSQDEVRRDLVRKMGFQYVDDAVVRPQDINFERSEQGTRLTVDYEKEVPFMYNISFLLHFEKSVLLQGNLGQ